MKTINFEGFGYEPPVAAIVMASAQQVVCTSTPTEAFGDDVQYLIDGEE